MSEFTLTLENLSGLKRAMSNSPGIFAEAGKHSLHDIMDGWKAQAIQEAPVDTETLRKNIRSRVMPRKGLNIDGVLTNNTFRNGFNYSYYQHEVLGNNYLDRPAEQNLAKWQLKLDQDFKAAAKKAGF